ncbi:MAG: PEPxxWA-CTERM sorting domain-containing protein [Burkholderiales bacterium]|nr:PEPxxWA-CTERM sorting domain-containing protein [Burkholderiales bacterium]MDE1928494.1 PEPxxWA-CTERM sorting domain-containing protein [Burkholderiales bacterium]MDE2159799.1 PEPxxWA-CTERM sorting domain-containing protein [Burkholderiales bacterium]MDE2503704.1 PEPxxWA-CTERM sorting domain-containing protein [Burkholderiales bacterium]
MKLNRLAAATALALPFLACAAPVVSVNPASQGASAGGAVSVTVAIAGMQGVLDPTGVQQVLSAFQLDLTFDTALLTFQSASFVGVGKFSAVAGDPCDYSLDCYFAASASGGDVSVNALSLETDATLAGLQAGLDGYDLFTLTFGVGAGDGNVATHIGWTSNPGVSPILDGNSPGNNTSTIGNVTYTGACIDIGNTGLCGGGSAPPGVPEPASWALVLLGLGGAGYASRRRARAAAPA